ncbi:hypothetical protein [Streptomyces otsuchiensis]|uniref:hypothetical protein n=1 Tax=Streptomyces otsuchiensis TaxID=2681388 RepID=UPI0010306CED|nr:hypothetical protein [Streptomyces otsuchiensis]
MRRLRALPALALLAALPLAACSSGDSSDDAADGADQENTSTDAGDDADEDDADEDTEGDDSEGDDADDAEESGDADDSSGSGGSGGSAAPSFEDVTAAYEDCSAIATHVADLVGDLPLDSATSEVDEYGAFCNWERPDATDLADIATFNVAVEEGPGEIISADMIESLDIMEVVPDRAVESAGGIAYSSTTDTGAAAVVVITVQFPDVQVTLVGGQFADTPELTAESGVEAAKNILGVG